MKDMEVRLKAIEDELGPADDEHVPNVPHESVPVGASMSTGTRCVPHVGREADLPLHAAQHFEHRREARAARLRARRQGLGQPLRLPQRATLARLERALVQFMIDEHTARLPRGAAAVPRVSGVDDGHGPAAEVRGRRLQDQRASE
jgi:seryl-tRNA synthetase